MRYPGVHVAGGARLSVGGVLSHGRGCWVATGANIIVPKGSVLQLGNHCRIGRHVELSPGGRMEIGDETSIQDRCSFLGDVSVGRYCVIALNVHISSGRHYYDLFPAELIRDQDRHAAEHPEQVAGHNRPVILDDDCWVGINAVIMPGVRVGKGAVIGANSVVTKDVVPYTVVAGVPARAVKQRLAFSPPREIVFSEPSDRPYFYSGFAVEREAILAQASSGGLVAQGAAVLALDAEGGKRLCVSAKSVDGRRAAVIFGDQRADLTPNFREIEFDLHDRPERADRLMLRAEPAGARWVLEKASIR